VGPEGVVGLYRKLHFTADDRQSATPDDLGLPTFDLPADRTGLFIGYDADFPVSVRSLASGGADLVACPSLVDWPPVHPSGPTAVPFPGFFEAGPTVDHFQLWRERARENNSFVAFANGAAPWIGWSGVLGSGLNGEAYHEPPVRGTAAGAAELVLDTTNVARAKHLLGMRMPIWYDAPQMGGVASSMLDSAPPSSLGAALFAVAATSGRRELVGMPS
jgi:predicted amidohydrolase